MGDDLAAKLEAAMKKPQGWMDIAHTSRPRHKKGIDNALAPGSSRSFPLLSWEEVGEWITGPKKIMLSPKTLFLPCPIACSTKSFVLRIHDFTSMTPTFNKGEFIFIDPKAAADNGNYVIVRFNDTAEVTFRQLVIEDNKQYLKASNPAWPHQIIEVDHNAALCGTVIFKGQIM